MELIQAALEAGRTVNALSYARQQKVGAELFGDRIPPHWLTREWKDVLLEMQADPELAQQAAHHLVNLNLTAADTEKLVPMLKVPALRLQVARQLARTQPSERRLALAREYDDLEVLGDENLDRASLDYLLEKLEDPATALTAGLALSKASWMQPEVSFEALRPHLAGNPTPAVLELAVGYPTELVGPYAHLFEAMEDNPSAWRHLLAVGKRTPADLARNLGHAEPSRRGDAIGLLADLESREHISAIAALLADPDADPRHRAVLALQQLDARDQAERIAPLTDDPHESVRDAAKQVLKRWKYKPASKKPALSEQDKAGALPSWRWRAARGKKQARLGGKPDLPTGLEWPPGLDFLAQLEAPEVGHLWFFVDPATVQDGPLARLAVLHAPSGTPLKARGKATFPAQGYTLEPELSLRPDLDGRVLSRHGQGREDVQHRYLGHPAPIQGDLCEEGWQLLLQVDSEEGRTWGDGGRLYFLIESERFAQRDFTKVFLEMQCY